MMFARHTKSTVHHICGKATALMLAAMFVFAPFAPVIHLPTETQPFSLGIETQIAHAAFGNGYDYRRSITIDNTKVTGSGDLTNFPVLISFTQPEFRTTGNGGNVTDADGDDIVFALDTEGASPLDFEIERYTASTGEIVAWVEIPTLDFDNDTIIYIFYGNASVTTSQENIAGTWDSNYVGVYHMDGSSTLQLDSASSSVRHEGAVSGATAGANGKVGAAYDFDGVNDVITVTDENELDLANTGTFEAWVKTDATTTWEQVNKNWLAGTAPNGAGTNMYSAVDSVVVGDVEYYASMGCDTTTETFQTATRALGGGAMSAWTGRTATGTVAATAGCGMAVDSDGKELWFSTFSSNGTATYLAYSTSTLDFSSIGEWKSLGNLGTLTGLAEGSSIDMVIVGDKAYFAAMMLNAGTEAFRVGKVNLDGSNWSGWTTLATTNLAGGTGESCSVSINSDGVKLYYSAHCNNGTTSTFGRSNSDFAFGTYSDFANDVDPSVGEAGATDFNFVDSALIGGHSYHAFYGHDGADDSWNIASSSPQGGAVSTWIAASSTGGLPDGSGAGETSDPAVESDGKTIYYTGFAHSATTEQLAIASTTLPAHPIISKHNAYEVIQTGRGYVFDWAGKPTTFGTTTAVTAYDHVVVTQDGTTMRYYLNGSLYSSTTVSTDFWSNGNNFLIGAGNRSTSTSIFFDGIIDEVRVSNTARSDDWITTQYNNQNATSTFYTLGAEQVNTAAPTVLTGAAGNVSASGATLFGNITDDGGDSITQYGFATSTSPSMSTNVSTTTLGSGSVGPFSGSVLLAADTVFYYRAYATNGAGTAFGTIRSFFTGNSNITRSMRLFEGFRIKLLNGKIIVNQSQ